MKKILVKKILVKKNQKSAHIVKLFVLYKKAVEIFLLSIYFIIYYQKEKWKLQKEACERWENLSEEEKDKKPQYSCEW